MPDSTLPHVTLQHRSEIVWFAILWRDRTVEDGGPDLSQVIEMGEEKPWGCKDCEPLSLYIGWYS